MNDFIKEIEKARRLASEYILLLDKDIKPYKYNVHYYVNCGYVLTRTSKPLPLSVVTRLIDDQTEYCRRKLYVWLDQEQKTLTKWQAGALIMLGYYMGAEAMLEMVQTYFADPNTLDEKWNKLSFVKGCSMKGNYKRRAHELKLFHYEG